MIFSKTPAGLLALKDRHGPLTQRQRSAFILFDGQRTLGQVLEATSSLGISMADVQAMLDLGLLAAGGGDDEPDGSAPSVPAAVAAAASALAQPSRPEQASAAPLEAAEGVGSGRSAIERYQAAYPVATQLTGGLGLRGLRLNLAVERVGSFEELAALAPRIRDAVGEARYARLHAALFD